MQPSLFHQDLARIRHADLIREATHRAQPAREAVAVSVEPRRQRLRLIRPRFALRLVPA